MIPVENTLLKNIPSISHRLLWFSNLRINRPKIWITEIIQKTPLFRHASFICSLKSMRNITNVSRQWSTVIIYIFSAQTNMVDWCNIRDSYTARVQEHFLSRSRTHLSACMYVCWHHVFQYIFVEVLNCGILRLRTYNTASYSIPAQMCLWRGQICPPFRVLVPKHTSTEFRFLMTDRLRISVAGYKRKATFRLGFSVGWEN